MKIAIIDSGIHEGHPHVGRVAGAIHVTADGLGDDPVDRLGHGTAVAGAIREKAPLAELYAVKVFDRRLSTHINAILRALAWCQDEKMDLVNLSLGTANPEHRQLLLEATRGSMIVVSAADMLPGSLPNVIGVSPDADCPRDTFRCREGIYYASPFPRPIPGVPTSQNLQGVSFSVANMTGLAAQVLANTPREARWSALIHLPDASTGSVSREYSAASGEG
jgi:subtilisin family serine protease